MFAEHFRSSTIAQEESTLRSHLISWTGRVRDSVYFSILDDERPEVKARLEGKLKRTCDYRYVFKKLIR